MSTAVFEESLRRFPEIASMRMSIPLYRMGVLKNRPTANSFQKIEFKSLTTPPRRYQILGALRAVELLQKGRIY
jgi:hypothetical protein